MHPPPLPVSANFTLMTECTPESSGCNSVYSVDKTHRSQCKMLSSKKILLKGTLRQVFIRVYRLEISCVNSVVLVFSNQLCDMYSTLPCCPSPLFSVSTSPPFPPPPFPGVNKYTVHICVYSACKGGGGLAISCRSFTPCF